jgi:L-ascorbate metabolism protein UlaG (beta-lactamase superfamily)
MKIKFIAQSGFIIESEQGFIAIDLWLDNPINKVEIDEVPNLDYILITHDHFDHGLMDSINLAKRDNAFFISSKRIQDEIGKEHGLKMIPPKEKGEEYKVGDLTVTQIEAKHEGDVGDAIGFMLEVEGKKIYHTGDSDYFNKFVEIGKDHKVDLLMIPIGSFYTMDPDSAAQAVKDIKPKSVIPMHYNTFDKIKQDPNDFVKEVKDTGVKTEVMVVAPGDAINY